MIWSQCLGFLSLGRVAERGLPFSLSKIGGAD